MKHEVAGYLRKLSHSWLRLVIGALLLGALLLLVVWQQGELLAPEFSRGRGLYTEPIELAISSPDPGATVRYTLDGSAPSNSNGLVYDHPISVDGTTVLRAAAFRLGLAPSPVETHTYIFLQDVINQPALPKGFPNNWTGETCEDDVPADYEMDPEIVDAPSPYADRIRPALLSLPTISIVTEMANLFDPAFGIYSNPEQEGSAWERKVSVEFFDPNSPGRFQIDCGLRIQGNYGRIPSWTPKHSFRLFFRAKYGSPVLRFPLFGEGAANQFYSLALRAGTQDTWTTHDPAWRQGVVYIRDQWLRDTQMAMGHPGVHGRFVHLYLNGVYWGLYNLTEWPNAAFMSSYLGADGAPYDIISATGMDNGAREAWEGLWAVASGDMTSDAQYQRIQGYLDLDNFIDYSIANHYVANVDWDTANWLVARKREPGALFRCFVWDAELTLTRDVEFESISRRRTEEVTTARSPAQLLQRLVENPEFRMLFADHVQRHLFNGGSLTPEAVVARWMATANQIDLGVIAESARWGDYRRETPYTRDDDWVGNQAVLLEKYFPRRTAVLLEQYVNAGLFLPKG